MKMLLSRVHFPVTTLGPGRRIGIWFQGCSIRCRGCVSVDTWSFESGETSVAAVVDTLSPWALEADGVTISGGEPFDQPEALAELLEAVRTRVRGDVLVFTGYPHDRVSPWLALHPDLVDALVTDPYDTDVPQTLALRGSDNQRLHLLTALGRERLSGYARPLQPTERALDVHVTEEGEVWLAGIPRRGDLDRLTTMLARVGHEVRTSEGRQS